jgi:hypothetical protein
MESATIGLAKEAAVETLGQFPIDVLFLMLTSGLFVVMAFPFDIFRIDFSSLQTFSITDLPKLVSSNFAPFINMKYLGVQFPTYLIMLLLVSIPFGVVIYLLYGVYERFNHVLMRGFVKKRICKSEMNEVALGVKLEFYKWARENRMGKYISLILSLKAIAAGLLYGGETFILIVFISMLLAWRAYWGWGWFVFSIILTVFLYVVELIYDRRSNEVSDALYNTFLNARPQGAKRAQASERPKGSMD